MPTVYFAANVPGIINISVIAASIKGRRVPATAGSIHASDETRYRPRLSGDGHGADPECHWQP